MSLPIDNFPLSEANVTISSAGDNTVVAAVGTDVVHVFKIFLVMDADVDVTFKNGPSTPISGTLPMLANGSIVLDWDGYPWFRTTVGNDFIINLSAPVTVTGRVYYTQYTPF